MIKALKNRKRIFLGIINLAIFVVIIIFGLWPFNFWPENKVRWLKDQNGLQFFGRGIVYSERPFTVSPYQSSVPETQSSSHYSTIPVFQSSNIPLKSFSMEIWLQSEKEGYDYTARIFSFYDGKATEASVLSQWKSGLILQRRIGSRPEESYPKVGIRNALPRGVKRFFTITSGPEGTQIYIDGRPAEKHPKFNFSSENDSAFGQLILGNSPGGKRHWNGNLYGLAIYRHPLTKEQVSEHFRNWRDHEYSLLAADEGIIALYPFDERSGDLIKDHAAGHHLLIPSRFGVLQKQVLVPPWKDFRLNRSYLMDIITNILGFIPFGFFLSASLGIKKPQPTRRLFFISILTAGCLSLFIELTQVYLPTRSSQLTDVIMNILGSAIGAALFSKYRKASGMRR